MTRLPDDLELRVRDGLISRSEAEKIAASRTPKEDQKGAGDRTWFDRNASTLDRLGAVFRIFGGGS